MQKTLVILMANFILPPAGVCPPPWPACIVLSWLQFTFFSKENYKFILSLKLVCFCGALLRTFWLLCLKCTFLSLPHSSGISGVAFWCYLASSWMFTVKTERKWSFPPSRTSGAGCWRERESDFSHKTYKRHPRAEQKSCTSRLYICTDVDLAQGICWSMCLSYRPHYRHNWAKDGYTGFDRQSASRTADMIKLRRVMESLYPVSMYQYTAGVDLTEITLSAGGSMACGLL